MAEYSPRHGLTDEDVRFVHLVHFQNIDGPTAYRECYEVQPGTKNISRLIKRKLESKRIRDYIAYLERPEEEIAWDIQREALLRGAFHERFKASERVIRRAEQSKESNAADRYLEIMADAGATVERPVPIEEGKPPKTITVSLRDLLEGRAKMRLPKDALLAILRRAGAPWNEKNPDAELSPLNEEMLLRREKIVVLHGGSGLGKSAMGGMRALGELCLPHRRVGIVGATYDHASSEFQYVYEGFLKAFGYDCAKTMAYRNPRTHEDMVIETIWGSSCIAHSVGMNRGGQMYGKEFDLLVLCEGSRIDPDAWWRSMFRGLQRRAMRVKLCDCPRGCENADHYWTDETGRAFVPTTPDSFDGASASIFEFVERITQRQPEKLHYGKVRFQESCYIREADCLENPDYDRDAYYAAEKMLDPAIFNEQFRGLRTRRSGLVWPSFAVNLHVRPMPSDDEIRTMRLGVGIDMGKYYAAVLVGVKPDHEGWILGEARTEAATAEISGLETMWVCLQRLARAFDVPIDGLDPASMESVTQSFERIADRIDVWAGDEAAQQKEDLMMAMPAPIAWVKPSVSGSVALVDQLFKQNQLFVARDPETDEPVAPELLWEIDHWKWRVIRPTQTTVRHVPEDRHNHSCDALRYLMVEMERVGPIVTEEEKRVTTVEEAYKDHLRRSLTNPMSGSIPRGNVYDVLRQLYPQ